MIESSKMKSVIRSVFFPTLAYYAATCLVPNKISFVIVTLGYIAVLWRMTNDFRTALGASYIALSLFVIGKTFEIELISARDLAIPWRPFGISADVLVTFQDAAVIGMALYITFGLWRKTFQYTRSRLLEFLLFLYPVITIIVTYIGSVRPEISFLHALFTLKPILVYYFFASNPHFSVRRVLDIFAAGLCLEAAVVTGQMMRNGPLGLLIEPIYNYIVIDKSYEVVQLIRYGGTYMHANALAHGLLIPLTAFVPFLVYRYEEYGKRFVLCFAAGFAVLAVTMSRSAWISFGVGIGTFIVLARHFWQYRVRFSYVFDVFGTWVAVVCIFAFGVFVTPRVMSTVHTMDPYGSVETRVLLLRAYSELIRTHPLSGVGLEMDVYTGYLRSLVRGDPKIDSPNRSVLQYFPEPVHNGLLRLAVQTGVLATAVYIGIYAVLFHIAFTHMRRVRKAPERLISLSLVCMVIVAFVNSMMQPILPDVALLAALTSIYTQKSI